MGALVFLIALPLSVYLLAGMASIVDGPNRSRALAGFALRLLLLALLLLLTPVELRIWIGGALVTVVVLHALTTAVVRYAVRSGRWPTGRID